MSELLSGQDFSHLFECCNYFGVKTSRWKFCVATVFGSKLAKPAPRRVLVLQLFSGRDPHPKKFAHAIIFGSRPTSCRTFSFAIIFGSRPYDGVSCTRLLRSVVSASCRFEWLDLNALLRAAAVGIGLFVPDWCAESALVLSLLSGHFLHSSAPFRCHGSARSLVLVAVLYGFSAVV